MALPFPPWAGVTRQKAPTSVEFPLPDLLASGACQFPFYLGAGAIAAYLSVGIGIMVAGAVAAASSALNIDEDKLTNVLLALAAVVALVTLITLVQAGVIFDYEGTDAFGRTAFAALGIVAVGAAYGTLSNARAKSRGFL